MKTSSLPFVLLAMTSAAMANTAPTVVIQSAAMRPGTTMMDVVYRVNDPDDATVRTRALAFVDGTRSFAKVLKPVTFVEGTAAKLGDAIPANVDHTLTWNVAADWNVDLGQVKFEVLAMDQRGLLPFDWITIPAAGGKPAITISKDAPADAQVLNALFWQYAAGDTGLSLTNGVLRGTAASGVFNGIDLVNGSTVKAYGAPFVFKRMNLAPATEVNHAAITARAGLLNTDNWHAENQAYDGISMVIECGGSIHTTPIIPARLAEVTAIAAGAWFKLVLKSDGTVAGWGSGSDIPATTIPAGLSGITAIEAGDAHGLALKSNGTVVAWGDNRSGQAAVPAGLSGVIAIAAGGYHNLALKSNGTVIAWGDSSSDQTAVPAGLSGVIAIAAGYSHSLALKSNGTVVGWGINSLGATTIPTGLSGVTAIVAGNNFSLALKSNGTVVGWGHNFRDSLDIPKGLSGVTAIAAGHYHGLALKSNGTVVAWGDGGWGQTDIPAGVSGVTAIAAGAYHSLLLKGKTP